MKEPALKVTDFAYGGAAIARDKRGRPIFVQGAIPGETVHVEITQDKGRYVRANLLKVARPSKDRVQPRCPHYGVCSGCHYQHMTYKAQLHAKREVVRDQLRRIGKMKNVKVRPTLPNPTPWAYASEVNLSPTEDGRLGFWSSKMHQVIPISTCSLLQPRLLELFQDIDLNLDELRKLTLRVGADGAMLAALEVEGIEPPLLEVDFPVSVAIVLPDKNAASLIGDPYLVQEVKGRSFRVSPGCFFQPSLAGAEMLIDVLLSYARLKAEHTVIEAYSGVGMLTSFLATEAREVIAIEVNDDAVADLVVNLDRLDNVTLYHGLVEEILPALEPRPDLMVVNPGTGGLASPVIGNIKDKAPRRLIYVSSEVATLARDGKALNRAGYRLLEVQPLDMQPQTYRVDTISLWTKQQ
ncbi:MAG: TRAM domain-containing protein [Chloroflexi bacterium]|jgi:23S rRNA (uracil1939-C5)-methyltransferase|nr:TRAM domain-containing protein [Chloroflexota bacterium]